MKFIQVSILCLASLVVMSAAKAAIQDRVPAAINGNNSPMEIRSQTTQTSNSDRPFQLAATLKSGQFVRGDRIVNNRSLASCIFLSADVKLERNF